MFMRFYRFYLCLVAFLMSMLAHGVAAREWSAADVPVPYVSDARLHVSDPDKLLGQAALDSANCYLGLLERECKVQNVLVVAGKVKDADAFRMAQDLGNKYGVGDKKNRRGLVVVIAVDDHKYFVAPGSGLEGELTDVDCDEIARACIVANMRKSDVDAAVVDVSRVIYNKVKTGRTGVEDIDDDEMGEDDWFAVILLCIIIFGIPAYMLVRYILEELGIVKKRKNTGGKGRRNNHDDMLPPFFFGGGGGFSGGSSGGFSGGSFGGGTFSGGGSGGGW